MIEVFKVENYRYRLLSSKGETMLVNGIDYFEFDQVSDVLVEFLHYTDECYAKIGLDGPRVTQATIRTAFEDISRSATVYLTAAIPILHFSSTSAKEDWVSTWCIVGDE